MTETDLCFNDSDGGVNISSFVNAILLTVAFTIATLENYSYWSKLKALATSCPKQLVDGWTYSGIYNEMVLTLSVIVYASVCELILATIYFLFRPPIHQRREKWGIYKERFLLFAVFFVTVIGTCATLIHFTFLLNYFNVPMDSTTCSYDTKGLWFPGVGAMVVSFFAGIYLMW